MFHYRYCSLHVLHPLKKLSDQVELWYTFIDNKKIVLNLESVDKLGPEES